MPRASVRIGEQFGINAETLRGWAMQADIEAGGRSGTTSQRRLVRREGAEGNGDLVAVGHASLGVVVDAVHDLVAPASRRVQPGELATQLPSDSVGLLGERPED